MKPITEYKDYRKFMQDFYDERKRTGAFSWREFSKLAGFASPISTSRSKRASPSVYPG